MSVKRLFSSARAIASCRSVALDGLGDEVVSAHAHRADGDVERRLAGDEDHGQVRSHAEDALAQRETSEPRHREIRENDVELVSRDEVERVIRRRDGQHWCGRLVRA